MAAATGPVCAPVLSQKQRRAALRKERRKRKRQALAQARENGLNNEATQVPDDDEDDEEEENEEDKDAEEERQRLHMEWLERERVAQDEFRLKFEKEEAARVRREEEERLIKEEWEARQKKEEEEQEQKKQEKRDREEAVQKMLDEAESQLEKGGGPWMNPEAPVKENSENYGTERDVANCPFFLKTGACRFGDRCSRKHVYPASSTTLLIRSMFTTFGMEEARRDDYDIDACLEHSEEELQEHFIEFYRDVLPEFRSVGTVVQFKVSCNYESHLRGNVYVQFEMEEQCKEALIKFNGRWYAGRQLHCELCPVTRWKNAICGLFDRQKCPKGKHCNFLHVFRNPGNEFWEADRDLSPRRNRREGWYSERRSDRSWRQRSPPRSERSHSRAGMERRRSTSRERQSEERGSWSRHSDRRSERYRSTNRERSRSRSRDRNRKRSRDTDKSRTKIEKRGSRDEDSRSRSRSRDRERHKRSRNHSPKEEESSPKDGTHRRHKHSKKSKKKSKKKHKKKNQASPEAKSSSEDSEKESPPTGSPKSEGKQEDMMKEENGEVKSSPAPTSENKEDLSETFEDSNSTAL